MNDERDRVTRFGFHFGPFVVERIGHTPRGSAIWVKVGDTTVELSASVKGRKLWIHVDEEQVYPEPGERA